MQRYFHSPGSFLQETTSRHSSIGIFFANLTDIAYLLKLVHNFCQLNRTIAPKKMEIL